MAETFAVSLAALSEYGLRSRSGAARALHRFAEDRPLPACATQAGGGTTSENPSDYKRVPLTLAAETRRFSLCSHGHCFGRVELAFTPDSGPDQSADSSDRPVV